MFYEDIFEALKKEKIAYVVVGGMALVLHGVVRLTADLDLVVALEQTNLEKFIHLMKQLDFKPKIPANPLDFAKPEIRDQWIKEKHMKVFSFYTDKGYRHIDVFVKEPIPFQKLDRDKKVIKINNLKIPICSKEHLIQLKKQAGRPQDLADIKSLKRLR